jgi:NAD(P)H-hydrate epimerase
LKVVTAAQMRELDRRAIASGLPALALMEKAGEGVARFVEALAGRGLRRVAFLCGKGNNGGDGFVAARLLRQRDPGLDLRVHLAASPAEVEGEARTNLERVQEAGCEVDHSHPPDQARLTAEADLIVDALLGTGLSGEVSGPLAELIDLVNRARRPVLSVDVPSGLDADTGHPCGRAVRADWTLTLGLPKLGLLLPPGIDHAGQVEVVDIGLPPALVAASASVAEMTDEALARSLLPRRARGAHKGEAGRVLVIAGSPGLTGAAALCAQGALRAGAGLVTLAIPASLNDLMEVKLTEVMTRPLPETAERTLGLAALPALEELAAGSDAIAIGPGLSRSPETQQLVRRLSSRLRRPAVMDADALNALAEDPRPLESEHAPFLLTPHPGELARFFGATPADIQADRIGRAEAAAARFGSVVLLKGACSVIAAVGERVHINPTGNPGMASGGAGDVLTGIAAALLAQGLSAFDAARLGAYLHGLAGDLAAGESGEIGMIAGDLLPALPRAIRALRGLFG